MSEKKQPAEVGPVELVLGPLPEAGMTEANPYLDMGPLDPHRGAQILTWYSADQMRAYASQERAAERDRWAKLADMHADIYWAAWDDHADPSDQGAAAACEMLADAIRGPNVEFSGVPAGR